MKARFLKLKSSGARIQVIEAGEGKDLLFLHGAGGHLPKCLGRAFRVSLVDHLDVFTPLSPALSPVGRGCL